jgi:CDP-diglyceride synthetase
VKIGPLVFAAALVVYGVVRRRRISRGEWVTGGIVLAGLLLYGTGLVHPPSIESLIKDAGEKLGKWTYLLVGLMAFLETGAFVGLIAPGEFTILVGGVVAGQGRIDVMALIALVWACAVAGDVTSYFLGRRLGRGFMERHGPKVKITHERLE